MLIPANGRFPTLLGHTPDEANRPVRGDIGRKAWQGAGLPSARSRHPTALAACVRSSCACDANRMVMSLPIGGTRA